MKKLPKIIAIVIMLMLYACSSHQDYQQSNQEAFFIHNAVIYEMSDDCWFDYNTSENILWNCDHVIVDDQWEIIPAATLLLDVHVTDIGWNARYINFEVRNEQQELVQAVYNYEIEFLDHPGTQYAVGMILFISEFVKSGIHTVDVWIDGKDGRTTSVYTVEIEVINTNN